MGRYRRVSGAQGVLAQKEVLEVSPYFDDHCRELVGQCADTRYWNRSPKMSSSSLSEEVVDRVICSRISWGRSLAVAEEEVMHLPVDARLVYWRYVVRNGDATLYCYRCLFTSLHSYRLGLLGLYLQLF